MQSKKSMIIKVVFGLVAVIIVAIATVFILKFMVNNQTNDNTQQQTKILTEAEQADALKSDAVKLLHSNKDEARELLEEARAKYEALGDTDAVVDIDAQLYLLDHEK